MSEFYKRFLMEDGRRLAADTGRFLALGAFGKHPGWDDHIEDLGLETESLTSAKRVLYVQGVGGQIDTGAWEKLKDDQAIAAFNHAFVWQRPGQFLVGRMWSSSDGKGRTRYPMIVCAHCIGAPLTWILEAVLPRLGEVEKACRATRSAAEVRSILDRARTELRKAINLIGAASESHDPKPALLDQFVSAGGFETAKEGWFRIIYWLQSQAGAFAPNKFSLKGDLSGLRAQRIRVPARVSPPTQAAWLWSRFLGWHVDRQVPVLLVWPSDGSWLDVIIGEPATQEFFCLRASLGIIPLATEVPYDLTPEFRDRAARQLDDFQKGREPGAATGAASPEGDDSGFVSVTRRWFKNLGGKSWLLLGLILVVAALVTFAITSSTSRFARGPDQPRRAQGAGQAQPPASATNAATQPGPVLRNAGDQSAQQSNAVESQEKARLAAQAETNRLEAEKRRLDDGAAKAAAAAAAQEAARVQAVAEAREKARTAAEAEATQAAEAKGRLERETAVATVASPPSMPAAKPAGMSVLGKIFTNSIGMVLLWVSGLPGSAAGGWVAKFEVTQAQYQKVMGSNPSKSVGPSQPVESVAWTEAVEFCNKLNAAESASGRLPAAYGYALPMQQQWDFFLADAKFEDAVTSRDQTEPRPGPLAVGSLSPNQYGLCDVLGNVWEWCADGDGGSPDLKVLKGGAFNSGKSYQFRTLERTTTRRLAADARSADAGFRCVVVEQPR